MLSVDPFDKYLDPPELPTHGPCDHCGVVFDNGDLNRFEGEWLCDECEAAAIEYIYHDRGDHDNGEGDDE